MEDKTKERFLRDIRNHEMIINRDDGLYRDVHFKRPGDCAFWFGLNTWPGFLCFYGDMGEYVFSRTDDMFRFFRRDKLEINHGYWHEKMQAADRRGSDMEFSRERFERIVRHEYEQMVQDSSLTEEQSKKLWQEIEDDVLWGLDELHEVEAMRKAINFKSEEGFEFIDFWEYNLKEYTFNFEWCLYGIVWGIQQYDAAQLESCTEANQFS